MKFSTILIKYIFYEHHSYPKIKIRKSSKKDRETMTQQFFSKILNHAAIHSSEDHSINTKLFYMKF
ncbi:hypothetical protein TYRP_022075, partial [Tyrophagus putrescentiae]